MEYYATIKKESNPVFCIKIGTNKGCYIDLSKPETKGQISYSFLICDL